MKRIILALSLSATLLVLPFSIAQTPNSAEQVKMLALIKEVQTQQAQIADNQAKIEIKLADIAEAIHVARIYSARAR